jgi:hypothetical protein
VQRKNNNAAMQYARILAGFGQMASADHRSSRKESAIFAATTVNSVLSG